MKEAKKLETKNILIDEENYKDIVIYFIRYFHNKNTCIVLWWINRKDWRTWRKKIMVDDYMLDKVLCNIKKAIDNEKFNDTKVLILMINCQIIFLLKM